MHPKHRLQPDETLLNLLSFAITSTRDGLVVWLPNGKSGKKIFSDVQTLSLLQTIVADMSSYDDEMVQVSLSVLGNILASDNLKLKLEDEITNEVLQHLVNIVASTKSKTVMQRVFHILVVQQFSKSVMSVFVESLLVAVPSGGCSIDCDYVAMINKFLQQCPDDMNQHICLWIKVLLQLSCHTQATTRQLAITTIEVNLKVIQNNKKKILSLCANLLKSEVLPKLKSLTNKTEILREVLSCQLPVYMSIIGEDYKRSSSLSNLMLQFLEKGFCHSDEQIKICAFKAWSSLIECFASNKDLLASPKYCKLFTQPLKLKLKSKALTRALIESMWKLAVCLDDILPELFETLCVPLLEVCFGGPKTMQPRRSSGRLSVSKHLSPYESIQVLGAEMLARLLLATTQQLNHKFTLEPLRKPFFGSPSIFARFHSTFLPTVCDTICHLNKLLPVEFLWELWNVVLKCTQETVSRKRDVEMFKSLYQAAQRIVKANISAQFLLSVVKSLTDFPSKILNSSLLYFSDTAVGVMHGTPVITVLQLLLSPQVCKDNLNDPKFFDCAKSIIACGMERQMALLEFIRSVIKHISTDDAIFLKIWVVLSDQITKSMLKTLNVNEGDNLEHDFSTLYEALIYPFDVIFNSKISLDASATETALSSWSNMFEQFVSCTNKIPTVNLNEGRHYIASQLLTMMDSLQDSVLQATQLQFFEVVCLKITTGTDFTQAKADPKKYSRLKSTKKSSKCEVKSVNYLEGFNLVLGQLLCSVEKTIDAASNVASKLPSIMPCIHYIFTNAPQSLVKPFFVCFAKILPKYMRETKSLPKDIVLSIEETWHQILLRLLFENSLFSDENVTELFVVAISHSTEAIYQACVEFWEMKVLDSLDVTSLPEELLDVLCSMYKKEGFSITWQEDDVGDEEMDLNVSTISDQSSAEEEVETVSESSIVEDKYINDVNSDDDTEGDDDITQLDQYRTTLESTSSDSFSDAVFDMSTDASSKESHNVSLSLRLFANDAVSKKEVSNHHVEDNFHDKQPIEHQIETLEQLNNESNKNKTEEIISTRGSSDDDSEVATASSTLSTKINHFAVNNFISEDEDSETSCQVISDSEEDANNSSCVIVEDCDNRSFQSASEELLSEQEVNSRVDTEHPSPLDESVYVDVIMMNASVGLNSSEEKSNVSETDSCANDISVTSDGERKAEESIYEEIEMVDSSLHPAQEQSISYDVSSKVLEQKEDEVMEELSALPDSLVKDSSIASDHSINSNNISLVTDEKQCPDESIYEIVEVGEISINTEIQLLEESSLEKLATVCDPGSTQQSPCKLPTTPTVSSPLKRSDKPGTEKIPCLISDTTASECPKPSVEKFTSRVVFDESNSKLSTCELDQNGSKTVTFNDSFDDCAQELGVEPLDSSFETTEQVCDDEDSAQSPKSLCKSENSNKTVEDVTTDNLQIEETVTSKVKDTKKNNTPRRRSLRKRTSTSKLLSDISNKSKRGQSGSVKLQSEVSAVEKFNRIEPVLDALPTSNIDFGSSPASTSGNTATIPFDDNLATSQNIVPDPVTPLEDLNSSNEQNHVDIQEGLPETALNTSQVVSNSETDLKSSVNDKERFVIPETNMMDSPESSGKPDESIVTPRSCLGKRLTLLRSGEEISPIGSPNSILKKRLTDALSPATKSRRVSFAEPISTSTICERETVVQSPASSPRDWRKTKNSHRLVSRRLSLPAPQRANAAVESPSPMSVRSANIAAAIADIKARGSSESSTLTQSVANSSTNSNSPRKSFVSVGTIQVSQLNNVALLKSLSAEQLSDLMENILEVSPIIHSMLMQKIKKV